MFCWTRQSHMTWSTISQIWFSWHKWAECHIRQFTCELLGCWRFHGVTPECIICRWSPPLCGGLFYSAIEKIYKYKTSVSEKWITGRTEEKTWRNILKEDFVSAPLWCCSEETCHSEASPRTSSSASSSSWESMFSRNVWPNDRRVGICHVAVSKSGDDRAGWFWLAPPADGTLWPHYGLNHGLEQPSNNPNCLLFATTLKPNLYSPSKSGLVSGDVRGEISEFCSG